MSESDEHSLFRKLMQDVKPLKKNKKITLPQEKPSISKPKIPFIDVPPPASQHNIDKKYNSLTKKQTPYQAFYPGCTVHYSKDLSEPITSESILDYHTEHLSEKHLQALIKGQIQIDSRIDLHGLERFEAQDRLHRFLDHAKSHQLRTLLVIHGKGSHHGETPILKQHIYLWLRTYPALLAMRSAHGKHGGNGALYVLLKKTRKTS